MSNEITLAELDVELLPERQTLGWGGFTFTDIHFSNASYAVQFGTLFSLNKAVAVQNVVIFS